MKTLEELSQDMESKTKINNDLVDAYHRREQELLTVMHKQLDTEFGDSLSLADEARVLASKAWLKEKDRLEVENAKPPYPEGTILIQWDVFRDRFTQKIGAKKLAGKAVLQVFKPGDPHNTVRRYDIPNPGDIVIRLLKKNGLPGKHVEKFTVYYQNLWLPEGVDHPNFGNNQQ